MARRVLSVVGTRPNLMKAAPVAAELERRPNDFRHVLVHTGQHYDEEMSKVFERDLGLREPTYRLEVGSGSHAAQTADVMRALEPVLEVERPGVVLVYGDVNSTLAAALTAVKRGIVTAHVEAGLRSFDRTMPEEINRLVTDAVSDHLFTHSPEAPGNLVREGRPRERVYEVGNTMVDTLVAMRPEIRMAAAPQRLGLAPGRYVVVTLHRPGLVDSPPRLALAMDALADLAAELPVVFPVHPRTRAMLDGCGLLPQADGLLLTRPLGYVEFLSLVSESVAVVTDSGGIQEETTFLGVPCFTLRDNTERPVTIELGTNSLLGLAPDRIRDVPALLEARPARPTRLPDGWDGAAASRIADVLASVDLSPSGSADTARQLAAALR